MARCWDSREKKALCRVLKRVDSTPDYVFRPKWYRVPALENRRPGALLSIFRRLTTTRDRRSPKDDIESLFAPRRLQKIGPGFA